MKLLLKILVLTFAFMIIIKSCGPFMGGHNPLGGQLAPDFTLKTTNGQTINMTQHRAGQPAMIFFWATWCPHCRKQLSELSLNRQAIESNGIKIILVDVGESLQKVSAYANANHISFNIFLDESTEIASAYEISGVPTFFFISREGIVVDVKNVLPDDYQEILLGGTS